MHSSSPCSNASGAKQGYFTFGNTGKQRSHEQCGSLCRLLNGFRKRIRSIFSNSSAKVNTRRNMPSSGFHRFEGFEEDNVATNKPEADTLDADPKDHSIEDQGVVNGNKDPSDSTSKTPEVSAEESTLKLKDEKNEEPVLAEPERVVSVDNPLESSEPEHSERSTTYVDSAESQSQPTDKDAINITLQNLKHVSNNLKEASNDIQDDEVRKVFTEVQEELDSAAKEIISPGAQNWRPLDPQLPSFVSGTTSGNFNAVVNSRNISYTVPAGNHVVINIPGGRHTPTFMNVVPDDGARSRGPPTNLQTSGQNMTSDQILEYRRRAVENERAKVVAEMYKSLPFRYPHITDPEEKQRIAMQLADNILRPHLQR